MNDSIAIKRQSCTHMPYELTVLRACAETQDRTNYRPQARV